MVANLKSKLPIPKKRANVNFISKICFDYVTNIIRLAQKKELDPGDVPSVELDDESTHLKNALSKSWDWELQKYGEKARLYRATLRVFWKTYGLAVICAIFESVFKIGQAVILGYMIQFFLGQSNLTSTDAYLLAMGLSMTVFLHSIFHHMMFFYSMRVGMQVRVAFIGMLYTKCLGQSSSSTSSGFITNMMANDVQRFEDASPFFYFIFLGPIETGVILYFLWRYITWGAFTGVGIVCLLVPVQLLFASKFQHLRTATVKWRDERIKSMSDLLSGITIIKLQAWEPAFLTKIFNLRRSECAYIKKASVLRGLNEAFFFSAQSVVALFAFVPLYFAGIPLNPANIFPALALLAITQLTMFNFFCKAMQFGAECIVSFERIETFLRSAEHESFKNIEHGLQSGNAVEIDGATFAWPSATAPGNTSSLPSKVDQQTQSFSDASDLSLVNSEALNEYSPDYPHQRAQTHDTVNSTVGNTQSGPALRNITFKAPKNSFVGIVGAVGSGKTSFLSALVGELELQQGRLALGASKLAYAPSSPWIIAGTVRDNITFGSPYDEERFNRVVFACALETDLELFANGADQVVGQRGVTLSGGQRARLGLARACYADSELVLLDDPLSAVDAKVAAHIVEHCFCDFLKTRTVLLATHQLSFIKHCDYIVVLERGKICIQGTFDQVKLKKDTPFMALLNEFSSKDAQSATVDDLDESLNTKQKALDLGVSNAIQIAKKDAVEDSKEDSKELASEEMAVGTVSLMTYWRYFTAGTHPFAFIVLLAMLIVGQAVFNFSTWWLANWSNKAYAAEPTMVAKYYPGIYFMLTVLVLAISCIRAVWFFLAVLASNTELHTRMLRAVLRSPITFFQVNPHGRVLNRFAKDLGAADEMLIATFFDFLQCVFLILGVVGISGYVIPWLLIAFPPLFLFFILLRRIYLNLSRQVKRMDSTTRSPVYSFVSSTLEGLASIRAFGAAARFESAFLGLQNDNTKHFFQFLQAARWLGFRLDMMASCFLTLCAFLSVGLRNSLSAGQVGLMLSYVLNLIGLLQWCVRQSAEVETYMVSIERMIEYTHLEPEAPEHNSDAEPAAAWPDKGDIEFKDLSLTYPGSETPVLKHISLKINGGEKVAVVGRTGAGKSSLLTTLFRLVEFHAESVVDIDGVSIKQLGLYDLRSRLAMIPQEPVLFRGSLRFNLDPLDNYSDDDLWRALDSADLAQKVKKVTGKLDTPVLEGGSNWSAGERQLICLARALLKQSKVLVMDEATSSIDVRTDRLIQAAIRGNTASAFKFAQSTVLTIAHRLDTIIDYDKVLVLSAGVPVEYGSPSELLAKPLSESAYFKSMVSQLGPEILAQFTEISNKH